LIENVLKAEVIVPTLCVGTLSGSYYWRSPQFAAGVQALLAFAGEACTPASSAPKIG